MNEDRMDNLIQECVNVKKRAQALAAFLKTGRAREFVETAFAMVGDTVNVYTYTWSTELQISVYVKKLVGFKDERLAGILAQFEYLNPLRTSMSENADNREKVFSYHYEGKPDVANGYTPKVCVDVHAEINSDSETCKQVVTGYTEARAPRPIYKLVCDGETDPSAEAA